MSIATRPVTSEILRGSPYQAYVYAYPHKTAYRPLDPPRALRDVWADERKDALFLYVHVPFCTMRCGFCNLFTQANPKDSLVPLYLDALQRQAEVVCEQVRPASLARFAVGGGTPTYLTAEGLQAVLDVAERVMGADLVTIPSGVEASPDTVTPEKLALLRARGVDRISIGIQSFVEAETKASGRPQQTSDVHSALTAIRVAGIPTLNVDLIYGLPGQTVETWLFSVREALQYRPEELYLYPLYVRPLTGLGRSSREWDDVRLACYRAGRDLLLESGYAQVSMRMFRASHAPADAGPVYCCQEDGMVGLGCGARSYTRGLHYSGEYAVGASGVRDIIAAYVRKEPGEFAVADHGFEHNGDEQRRRYLLQSVLNTEGLDLRRYEARFGTPALSDVPELDALETDGLLTVDGNRVALTAAGLERSDAIGPYLFSTAVRVRMEAYEPR
jgi:oxygen-independent coproporphyrinogen III oxidase